ncbi:hypothetical protein LTR78_010442 [Recurvomyces mirabilis]|uniref:Uncharacterized protein n=1 Tax=Recurvomyces mirabilis TaxID=574656 RepID=A0AAE0TLT6_9PEZI|nr:hypothetical protein LTR78_010442 [Recurvomyces mirabilis]KAK5150521.1 hypothetical protein LTS14_010014 [Recurvomyces mirabilis]
MFADMLPRNRLLTFSCDASYAIDRQAIETLYARQRYLRTFRTDNGDLKRTLGMVDKLVNITQLHMEVYSPETAKTANAILNSAVKLQHLEIRADLKQYCKATQFLVTTVPPWGHAQASKAIINTVFHREVDKPCDIDRLGKKRILRSLQIYDLCSDEAANRLVREVDFARLDSSSLLKCEGMISLLRLVKRTGLPARMNLTELILTQPTEPPGVAEHIDDAIDDFLGSFGGLHTLVIHGPSDENLRPSLEALAAHSSTLRLLYLGCCWVLPDDFDDDDLPFKPYYEVGELGSFLAECANLEQLALDMPEPILEIEEQETQCQCRPFAEALSRAHSLRALRTLTMPNDEDVEDGMPDSSAVRISINASFSMCANAYLTYLANLGALSLVHGGKRADKNHHHGDIPITPRMYGRGTTTNAYGRKSAVALPLSKPSLQEIEPVSSILDIDPSDFRMMRRGMNM